MSDTDLVLVNRHGGTAVLTLNMPHRRNVLSAELVAAVGRAVDDIEADPGARCIVVTGAGPAFCAGAELSTLEAAAGGDFDGVRVVYEGFLRILHSPLVTIAAVNGPAVGAGFNLALACDIRLAGERALFDSRFAKLRIHPGGGNLWMLIRAVGAQRATLATVFGERWDARAALDAGLVAAVYPAGELVPAAIALGRRLDDHEPVYVKRLIRTVRDSISTASHAEALVAETAAQEWSTTRPAFHEGVEQMLAQVRDHSNRINVVVDENAGTCLPCRMSLNHIGVTVGDLDKAIDFYTTVFGLTLLVGAETATRETDGADRRAEVFGERWRGMRLAHLADENGTGIELFQFLELEPVYPAEHFDYWRIGVSHVAFTSPDLEEVIARLEANGGKARTGIHEVRPGCRICYCMDPWGNPVELSTGTYPETHPSTAIRNDLEAGA